MGFILKLMIGGSCCAVIGVWWLIDGLTGGVMERLVGGMIWKGPLLTTAGIASVAMGYRMFRRIRSQERGKDVATGIAEILPDLWR